MKDEDMKVAAFAVHKFRHFKPGVETRLWQLFLSRRGQEWDRFLYDVRVGKGKPAPEGISPAMRSMWEKLTQKRIDVVGWKGTSPTIIEVKHYASLSSIGQLLGYECLWNKEHPNTPCTNLILVCQVVDDDILEVAGAYGVEVEVIEAV